MPIVTGIIVRRIKEKIYADPGKLTLNTGDRVIVETEHGLETGLVCEREKNIERAREKFGTVVRLMTPEDRARLAELETRTQQSLRTVQQKVEDHELAMKLTCVQYTFDRNKLFVYYTAENRVDFRELIRDLGHILKTRIQMVQIGVRDEAKMIGGIATCGRTLCCQDFLKEFSSVTIEMAKDQELSLNTVKLSGLCGRLMCCLGYEHDYYKQCRRRLPRAGVRVQTPDGPGQISSVNCLTEIALVELADKVTKPFPVSQLTPPAEGPAPHPPAPRGKK